MDALQNIANEHGLYLIEDACEAHGAEYQGHKVGSFGDIATFSFFFSHHISTVEGGMIVTNDDELATRCRSMRAFGWIREMPDREEIARRYDSIDERFLFLNPGFNFRPTEVQGAFGIHQVPRLEGFIAHRRENAAYWNRELAEFSDCLILQEERPNTRHVWFAYPIMVREGAPFTARELAFHLEKRGVETRPIESGCMAIQPAMKDIPHRISGDLKNARAIHERAFFIGNHTGVGKPEREAIVEYIREFMRSHRG